jgi:hypothetical protein
MNKMINFVKKHKILTIILVALVALVIYSNIPAPYDPYAVRGEADQGRIEQLAIQNKDVSICNKMHQTTFSDVSIDVVITSCYRSYSDVFPSQNVCAKSPNPVLCG